MILDGLLLINGIDPFVYFGAFLSEDKPGDLKNYSELLKPSAVKLQKEVSFRELDGVKLPDEILQRWEARDVTLRFAIIAPDRAAFLGRYSAFLGMLRTGDKGWLDIYLPELDRHFKMHYKECSDYRQLTDFEGEVAGRFEVKFREPKPIFSDYSNDIQDDDPNGSENI